jgi:hypothetical protein
LIHRSAETPVTRSYLSAVSGDIGAPPPMIWLMCLVERPVRSERRSPTSGTTPIGRSSVSQPINRRATATAAKGFGLLQAGNRERAAYRPAPKAGCVASAGSVETGEGSPSTLRGKCRPPRARESKPQGRRLRGAGARGPGRRGRAPWTPLTPLRTHGLSCAW